MKNKSQKLNTKVKLGSAPIVDYKLEFGVDWNPEKGAIVHHTPGKTYWLASPPTYHYRSWFRKSTRYDRPKKWWEFWKRPIKFNILSGAKLVCGASGFVKLADDFIPPASNTEMITIKTSNTGDHTWKLVDWKEISPGLYQGKGIYIGKTKSEKENDEH